jgi:hypothetical protein
MKKMGKTSLGPRTTHATVSPAWPKLLPRTLPPWQMGPARQPPTHAHVVTQSLHCTWGPPVTPFARPRQQNVVRSGEYLPWFPSTSLLAGPPSTGHITVVRPLSSPLLPSCTDANTEANSPPSRAINWRGRFHRLLIRVDATPGVLRLGEELSPHL